jgi:predicted nicotinamide N-methyase
MGPVSDIVVTSFGDTIFVELGMHVGFDLTTKLANDLVFDKPIKKLVPIHSSRLETTGVKVLLITLKYKHTMSDAALGFYRSSLHS